MNVFQNLVDRMINETTTSGDIAFVPSHVGAGSQKKIKNLLKKKKSWKIKMFQNPITEEYTMDLDGHGIKIQKAHWDAFQKEMSEFGDIEASGDDRYFSVFSNLIAEATADEMSLLRDDLRDALLKTLDESPCSESAKLLSFFGRVFSGVRYLGDDVAVLFDSDEEYINRLLEEIEIVYGDDRGAYEMLIGALEQKQSLKFSSVINEFKYLFGASATASIKGVAIKYECYIDMNFVPFEKISVLGSDEAISEMDGFSNIKVIGTDIYPRDKHFAFSVFQRLKKEIEMEASK